MQNVLQIFPFLAHSGRILPDVRQFRLILNYAADISANWHLCLHTHTHGHGSSRGQENQYRKLGKLHRLDMEYQEQRG
jgi:hypothetical protein